MSPRPNFPYDSVTRQEKEEEQEKGKPSHNDKGKQQTNNTKGTEKRK